MSLIDWVLGGLIDTDDGGLDSIAEGTLRERFGGGAIDRPTRVK